MAETAQSKSTLWSGLAQRFDRKQNVRRVGSVTGLDFDGRTLRVAQATLRGERPVLTEVAARALQFPGEGDRTDPAVLGSVIAATLGQMKIRPGAVVMGVPRNQVVLRTLALPATGDVRELASMVHMQIGKDLPFRADEAIIDFKVRHASAGAGNGSSAGPATSEEIGSESAAKVEVLVASVRRELVDYFQKVASAAKLKLIGLGWLSEANARSLTECPGVAAQEGTALVSVRADELGIDVVVPEALVFSRGVSLPAEAEPEAGSEAAVSAAEGSSTDTKMIEAVTIEVVRSLHSYGGMQTHAPVGSVWVAGATGKEEAVVASLRQRLSIPCQLLDAAAALGLKESTREQTADCLAAIGLALGVNDEEGLPFDFLNPKRPAVQRDMGRIRTLSFATAGVVLLIGLLGFRSHLINQRLKVQRAVQAELSKAEKFVPTYRKMQLQAATILNWNKDARNWLEQYAYLSAVLPPSEDLYLTSVSISGQGNIHLAVQARSGEIIADLDRQLRKAGYEVKPLAITPGSEKHGYNFRSTVELIVPSKMKVDLSKVQAPARPTDDASLDSKKPGGKKGGRS